MRGLSSSHGQPRDGKSLAALEICIGVAAKVNPFGLQRLCVPEPARVLYLTEEDSEAMITERFSMLLKGHEVDPPENLHVSIRKGVDLDSKLWQERLIKRVQCEAFRLIVLDPLRALTQCVDQGPAELQPFAKLLRRILRETDCVVVMLHHDTKPRQGFPEDRKRAQRVSGGGIFAIADSPISVQRVGDHQSQLIPSLWKFFPAPPPIMFAIETKDDYMRLVGSETEDREASDIELESNIQIYLQEHPWASTSKLSGGINVRRESVRGVLDRLEDCHKVKRRKGPHNAIEWALSEQKETF